MTDGTVKTWSDEEGWGSLSSPDVPGDVWVHMSALEMEGYRNVRVGQQVRFEWEHFPPGQDGFFYRATRVLP